MLIFQRFMKFDASGLGSSFTARCPAGLGKGTKCWLAVRPEKIAISKKKDPKATNQVSGKVDDIAYVGNLSTYHVRLENGAIIKAQEVNRRRVENREITWEDKVWLAFTEGAGLLLPE